MTRLTIDDFERLPADVVRSRELINGELVDVSGSTPRHNLLRDRLLMLLLQWVRDRGSGTVIAGQEFEFLGNAHGPDVSFFGAAKQKLVDLDKRVQRFVPDLAIEIASESDTYDGLLRKKVRYRRAGVVEVWLISITNHEVALHAERGVTVLGGGDVLASDSLPGFRIPIDELFRGL